MSLASALDSLHARVVRVPAAQYFTAMNRVLLAIGFVPPGITKIRNVRFTTLPLESPVGFFFEAFYRNTLWYQTVGWAQVIAALLLLWPRTAALGAVLYLPIIVNITLVTIGVGFTGTPVITVLMTLAALWLVCWEYDAWRGLMPWGRDAHGTRTVHAAPAPTRTPSLRGRALVLRSAGAWALASLSAYATAYVLHVANAQRTPGLAGVPVLALLGAAFGTVVALMAPHTVRATR
jgi:hypothetical protein